MFNTYNAIISIETALSNLLLTDLSKAVCQLIVVFDSREILEARLYAITPRIQTKVAGAYQSAQRAGPLVIGLHSLPEFQRMRNTQKRIAAGQPILSVTLRIVISLQVFTSFILYYFFKMHHVNHVSTFCNLFQSDYLYKYLIFT